MLCMGRFSTCRGLMCTNDINQWQAIRREFDLVAPTVLKNPLVIGWGLLPTLQWVGSWFYLLN